MFKKNIPNGIILWEGQSRIDNTDIVALATGLKRGNNKKTGNVIQVWILAKNIHPCEAKRTGKDFGICGDCKHRHFKSCYVEMLRGPISVYNAYKAGSYVKYNSKKHLMLFKDKVVRIGAYGDPVAIPLATIKKIHKVAKFILGYTHQWKMAKAQSYKPYLMASVDTISGYHKEFHAAISKGWRTFRARSIDDTIIYDNEMICPASAEAGKLTNCHNCGACSGSISNRKNPVIVVHGFDFKTRNYVKGMKAIKNKKKWKRDNPGENNSSENPIDILIEKTQKEISINTIDKQKESVTI